MYDSVFVALLRTKYINVSVSVPPSACEKHSCVATKNEIVLQVWNQRLLFSLWKITIKISFQENKYYVHIHPVSRANECGAFLPP